jgi:hypothetical protein
MAITSRDTEIQKKYNRVRNQVKSHVNKLKFDIFPYYFGVFLGSLYQIFFIFFFQFIHMALNLVSHSVVLLLDLKHSKNAEYTKNRQITRPR